MMTIQPKRALATSQKPIIPFQEKGPEWKNGNSAPGRNRIAIQILAKPIQRGLPRTVLHRIRIKAHYPNKCSKHVS